MANLMSTEAGRAVLRRIACFLGRNFMAANLPRNFILAYNGWKASGYFDFTVLQGAVNELTQDEIAEFNSCLASLGCLDDETQSDMTIHVNAITGSDVSGDGSSSHPYASLFFLGFLPKHINHKVRVLLETDVTAGFLDFQFQFGENGSFSLIGVGEPVLAPTSIGSGPFALTTVDYIPGLQGYGEFYQSTPFTAPGETYGKWMRFTAASTLANECIPFSGFNLGPKFTVRNGFSATPIVGDEYEIIKPKITLNCQGLNANCRGSTLIKDIVNLYGSKFNILNLNIDFSDSTISDNEFVLNNQVETIFSFVTIINNATCRIKSDLNRYAAIDTELNALSQSNLVNLTNANGNGTCCGLNFYRESWPPASYSSDEIVISVPAKYVCALNCLGKLVVEGTSGLTLIRSAMGQLFGRLASSCYGVFLLTQGDLDNSVEIDSGASWRLDYLYMQQPYIGIMITQGVLRLGPGSKAYNISGYGVYFGKGHSTVFTDQSLAWLAIGSNDIHFPGGVGDVAFPIADAIQTDSLGNTLAYISTT